MFRSFQDFRRFEKWKILWSFSFLFFFFFLSITFKKCLSTYVTRFFCDTDIIFSLLSSLRKHSHLCVYKRWPRPPGCFLCKLELRNAGGSTLLFIHYFELLLSSNTKNILIYWYVKNWGFCGFSYHLFK